jgi:glycosyltransferase involved in cell wall biosynthesis
MSVRDGKGRSGRVCVLRQGEFPLDVRVRREVSALVASGLAVDVICVRGPGEPMREVVHGARVYRLPVPSRRGGRVAYVARYGAFFLAAAVAVSMLHARRRYRLVQVHSLPDVLVFAAAVPRLLGTPVLLDLHECLPEFYATKFGIDPGGRAVRLLERLERASIAFATAAITCTEPMRQLFVGRGAPSAKVTVVLNSADESIFHPDGVGSAHGSREGFTLVSHGTMEDRYGLDTAILATVRAAAEVEGLRLELYGDGSCRPELEALVERLDAGRQVSFSDGYVPLDDLVAALRRADAGVVAVKRDAFRDVTHCNKMFELISMGIPAIVSRTRSVEEYFDDSCFLLFDGGDEEQLAGAIVRLARDPVLRRQLAERARHVNEPYRWPHQRERYLEVVTGLLGAA